MMKSNKYQLQNINMIKQMSKIAVLSLVGMTVFFTSLHAQTTGRREEAQAIRHLESNPKLSAENVHSGFELVAVDSMLMRQALKMEGYSMIDELYDDIWDTRYVKAYGDVKIPDSYTIDVSDFVMPIEGKVTSNYGPRKRRYHYGTDIKLQKGDTVYAAFDGKIRVKLYERRGYGYYLVVRHSNGLETVYGHLSKFLVDQDQIVRAGEPIALGGNTGRSTGAHLHFEFRFVGQPINPSEIIDFDEFCVKDDIYVFNKMKSSTVSSVNKYTAQGSGKIKYYKIRSGDTLGSIAKRNKTTVSKLCRLNNIKSTATLKIGRSIRLT